MSRGESSRATCPRDILVTLLKGGKTFEQIVSELRPHYSRGTINKYLNELYENELVTRVGRRGPYILTKQGEQEAKKYEERQNILEDIETRVRAQFAARAYWLKEFERDFEYFRDILKLVAEGELTESEVKLLIKWGEVRLIKEHKKALEAAKEMYSKLKYHFVAVWSEPPETIDTDREIIESHKRMIKQTEQIVFKLTKLVESGEIRNAQSLKSFYEEAVGNGWIFDHKRYLNFIAYELEKIKT